MNYNTKPISQDVLDKLLSVTYTLLPSGVAIVCEITFKNLHTVHGIAKVVDMENFDLHVGRKAAYNKALDAAFEFIAYDMHTAIASNEIPSKHAELTAKHKSNPLWPMGSAIVGITGD